MWDLVDADRLKQDHHVLKDCNGLIKSGELVAILGPSGSGKTSLLNILARRINLKAHKDYIMTGSVKLNNAEMTRQNFMDLGAYLEQDDVFWETYNARELFTEAAQLRTNLSRKEIESRVESMINSLNLRECQDRIVGGTFLPKISGGERKRIAFGCEMITDPRIILMDEPTSGLDSFNAFSVLRILKRQTQSFGCSIVCTLHQPSSDLFKLFDRVICLSEGRTLYNGRVADIKPYFEGQFGLQMPRYTNPSDYLIKLATDTRLVSADLSIEELVQHADKSYAHYVKEEMPSVSKLKASSLKSIKTVRGTHFAK